MRKLFTLFAILVCCLAVSAQTTIQIGTGTLTSSTTSGPVYNSTTTPSYSRQIALYTASEINTAGFTGPGYLSALKWYKADVNGYSLANATFKIWVKPVAMTSFASTPLTWSSEVSGATLVYTSTTQNLNTSIGWQQFTFNTPFYWDNTSNLQIFVEWSRPGAMSPVPLWQYSTTTNMNAITGSTSSMPTTCARNNNRPNIQMVYYNLTTNNAGAVSFTSPASPACGGLTSVALNYRNAGLSTLTDVTLNWSVNGLIQTPVSLSSLSLATGAIGNAVLGSYTFGTGTYTLKAWTSSPNLTTDGYAADDTTTFVFQPAMTGAYTINSASPTAGTNFQTFTDFASYINGAGVCGPVTVDVDILSGPYTNQMFTLNQIAGASATNTITINGNGRVFQFVSTVTGSRGGITLNGTDRLTINDLNINCTGVATTEYGIGILFMNGADTNTISNCNIIAGPVNTTSTNYAGIAMTGATSSATTAGNNGNYNTISGCTITGGYYGIVMYGTSTTVYCQSNVINNNTLTGQYSRGVQSYYQNLVQITNNDFLQTAGASGSSAGIYSLNNDRLTFTANNIIGYGFYGIYLSNANYQGGAPTSRALIANNMLYPNGIFTGTAVYGIYVTTNCYNLDVYHNSVNMALPSNGYCLYILGGSATYPNNFTNNVFRTEGTNVAVYNAASTYGFTMNYNDIYCPSNTNQCTLNGISYTAATMIGGGGYNANSVSVDPGFISASDLHATASAIDGIGSNLTATVPVDFDGVTRCPGIGCPAGGLAPDLGADEYPVYANDAGITAINSLPCSGTVNVDVTLRNFGTSTLTSANILWKVNGIPQPTFAWSGSLPTGSDTVVTIGTYAYSSGTYSHTVFSASPNGFPDLVNTNDTTNSVQSVALSGAYTIDATAPTAGTNFQTFTDLASVLNSSGLCGPTVVSVVAGTGPYLNQAIVLDNVPGLSSVNTLLIDGNGENFNFTSTNTNERAGIKIKGCDYITITELNINAIGSTTAEYGYGIHLFSNADNITIQNCTITTNASLGSSNYAGIVCSNSNTSATTSGSLFNNLLISNNTINGGYYAITCLGTNSTTFNQNNQFTNNTLSGYYYYGIYTLYNNLMLIDGNDMSQMTFGTTAGYGIYNYYSDRFTIVNNNVLGFGTYGIYNYYANYQGGAPTTRALIANNMLNWNGIGASAYAIYFSTNGYNVDVWHNSCYSSGYSCYVAGGSASYPDDFTNNIFVSSTNQAFYNTTAYGFTMDYNDYWAPTSTNLITVAGTAYTSATFVGGGGLNANSLNVDPIFASATDLHASGPSLNNAGTPLAAVTSDIDGDVRCPNIGCAGATANPDMGADEFLVNSDDAGVTLINSLPCSGLTPVTVTLRNFGLVPLTSATIHWVINGVPQTPYSFTGSVAVSDDTVLTLGSYTFVSAVSYTIVSYSTSPNGSVDGNNGNDTSSLVALPALSGIVTINSAVVTGGTNYQTFNDFASDLNTYGVCGPLTVNVVPGSGPYVNQQIALTNIAGVSAVNTVTINGNNELLTFVSTNTNDRALIKMIGTDYVTLNQLNILNTGTTTSQYGYGIQIMNGCDFITIQNCTVTNNTVLTSTNYAGIVFSNSNTSATTSGGLMNSCTVSGNTITGGYYGITMVGGGTTSKSQNCVIENNTVTDHYLYGIYALYQNALTVTRNTTNQSSVSTTSGYGLYTSYVDMPVITRNKFIEFGLYGIYLNYANYQGTGAPVGRGLVANNMISNNGNGTGPYGLYVTTNCLNMDFFHNSVQINNGSTYALYIVGGSATYPNSFQNNILSHTSGGYPLYNSTLYGFTIDYNDYWAPSSTNVCRIGGVDYTPATFVGGGGFNTNSYNVIPGFISATDFHTYSSALLDSGVVTVVTDDYDGQVRCPGVGCPGSGLLPDIGADEYELSSNDAGVIDIANSCPGTITVTADIQNFGIGVITSADVHWTVNGIPQPMASFSGTLGLGASTTVNLGSYTFIAATTYTIKAWTANVNAAPDVVNTNDTLTEISVPAMGGTFTINSALATSGSNFTSFTDFANTINAAGICAPVVVNVVAGSGPYINQQIVLNAITGASNINTITINGNNETFQFNSTVSTARAGIRLNGTDWLTINDLNIVATGTTTIEYGYGIQFMTQADHNTIDGCTITTIGTLSSSNYAGIVFSNSTSSATTSGNNGNYNTITNCTINGGYYGISMLGTGTTSGAKKNVLSNNTYTGSYLYCNYLYYQDSMEVVNNTIETFGFNATYGLYIVYGKYMNVHRNKIVMNNAVATHYGIYASTCSGNATDFGRIANNMITTENGLTTSYGIYSVSNTYMDIMHNSVNIQDATATTRRAFYFSGTSPYGAVRVLNNIGKVINGHVAYVASLSYVSYMDFNDWVPGAGYVGYYSGSAYSTLASWQAATAYDDSSQSVDPLWFSSTDLHTVLASSLNNAAYTGTGSAIAIDFDGQTRCPGIGCPGASSRPDIGADEFEPSSCATPSGLVVTTTSSTSATIDWTAGGTETQWSIYIAASPAVAPSYLSAPSIASVGSHPYTITGLSPTTGYDIWVRAICSSSDSSVWLGPILATTDCPTPSAVTLPWSENFETISSSTYFGSSNVYCGTTHTIKYTQDASGGRLRTGVTALQKSTGFGAATLDRSPSGTAVRNDLVFTVNMSSYVGTPNVVLGFDFSNHADEINPEDQVYVRGNNSAPWLPIYNWGAFVTAPGTYNTVSLLDLDATLSAGGQSFSSTTQLMFSQKDDSVGSSVSGSDGLSLDNLIIDLDGCPTPTALGVTSTTATSAVIDWTPGVMSTGYIMEYGPVGFTLGTGTVVSGPITGSDPPVNITGLIGGNYYSVYVREVCSGPDTTVWIGPDTFLTAAPAIPVNDNCVNAVLMPLTKYGSGTNTEICNSVAGTNVGSTIELGEPTTAPSVPGGTMNNTVWYKFPTEPCAGSNVRMKVTTDNSGTTLNTRFNLWAGTGCDYSTFTLLGSSEDEGSAAGAQGCDGVGGVSTSSFLSTTALPAADTIYVQVDGYGFGVGNFELNVTVEPDSVTVTPDPINPYTKLNLTWTNYAAALGYDVYWRRSTGSGYSTTHVTSNSHVLNSLLPGTSYTAWYRLGCGGSINFDYSRTGIGSTDSLYCGSPNNVVCDSSTSHTISMHWSIDTSTIRSYVYYRRAVASGYTVRTFYPPVSSTTLTSLVTGSPYEIWVNNMCAGGVLVPSTHIYCTPQSARPEMEFENSEFYQNEIPEWTYNDVTYHGISFPESGVDLQIPSGLSSYYVDLSSGSPKVLDREGGVEIDLNNFQPLIAENGFEMELQPSVTSNSTMVRMVSDVSRNAQLTVFDVQGNVVFADQLGIVNGNADYNLAVDFLSAGVYHVVVNADDITIARKLVVVK